MWVSWTEVDEARACYTEWSKSEREKQIAYINAYIWNVEKAMAPHSSTPAWKIPWMEEPGRLQSMGLHRVGHDWSDLAVATATTLCPPFVLCICISFPALQISSSIPFFYISHIYVLIYNICFSLSDLYFILYMSRSIYNSTNDLILFLLWLSNTPLYMCTTSSLSIHLLMEI